MAGMHALSPAGSVFALDVAGLLDPSVTFWSGWRDDTLVAIGALRTLDAENAEIKSMRVASEFLGTGAGRATLRHILSEAALRGVRFAWLETGSSEAFLPARQLYLSEGFTFCGAFGDYVENPFSVFMRHEI
ncbi:GNAT family N-acetyltransferase [Microbacterium awajiense]|uniref:GNAT family N-acetyltransferase n=2 Tax=Microbacterium awajiense TaxID=415214 RepID=A0ABP7ANT1_9MICO